MKREIKPTTQGDRDFASLVRKELTNTRIRVRIGSLPACFMNMIGREKLPEVGEILELENTLENGKPLRVQCWLIKDMGNGDFLYYMEMM